MKLLLVDDEPGIREGLAALLRRKGHEVLTAGDCARAAAQLRDGDLDLVLTDWRLPDGLAESFLQDSPCPAVAMSGHPEEIVGHPAVREVLTKPVSPSRLVELIASFESRPADVDEGRLPRDVAALVAVAIRLLGDTTVIEDDGTFVVARAELRDEAVLTELRELGGDLRVLAPRGAAMVELRWFRDGRPDAGIPVITPEQGWPDADEFAVDFTVGPESSAMLARAFGACLDRAAAQRSRGRTVHFLNVPDSLLSWTSDQGRSDDMPMRAPVGPRLPAVLADLWS